jgi:hypothetical protein
MVVALDGSLAESTVPPNAVEVCNFWESIAYASEVRHYAREAHALMFVRSLWIFVSLCGV